MRVIFGISPRVLPTPFRELLMRMNIFSSSITQTLTKSGMLDEKLKVSQIAYSSSSTTFMVDDWLSHTPPEIIAQNFGLKDASIFNSIPTPDPYILNATVSTKKVVPGKNNKALTGAGSYVYHTYQHDAEPVPGGGGEFRKIDSTNFPISKTIAATVVKLKPKGLRELHWHPNVRWLQS
jgi:oxalate decarboxylase